MQTFDEADQAIHRQAFIQDCRQKAWGAACNADWIGKQSDELTAQYEKLKQEDAALEAEIKALETAIDSHMKDNRDKRKTLQEKRNSQARALEAIGKNIMQANAAMQQLYANVEQNLALAEHAKKWEWKESQAGDDADAGRTGASTAS